MLFAEMVDVVQKYSTLIGIGLGVLLIIVIPPVRRSIINSFIAGKKAGEEAKKRREKNDKDPQDGLK